MYSNPLCDWEITGSDRICREQSKPNPLVAGSSPARPTTLMYDLG
jgi:hypothetical protein